MSVEFARARSALITLAVSLLAIMPASAQRSADPSVGQPPAREVSQFDFFIGDWLLVGKPVATTWAGRIHGVPEVRGTWKAWREFDGRGVEDELRLTDRAGNPLVILHSMRAYDPEKGRWIISALNPYRPAFSSATAERRGEEMTVTGSGTDTDARAYLTRSRYFEIKPSSFRYNQERSYDGGRTWAESGVKIEAKRVVVPSRK